MIYQKKIIFQKKIDTREDLINNLIIDLEFPTKKHNNPVQKIEMLGQKTLSDTMGNINNFLFNDVFKA